MDYNVPIASPNQLIKTLKIIGKKENPDSVYIVGPSGLGKTSIVREVSKELGYEIVKPELIMAGLETFDLRGLPNFREIDGKKVTEWAPPFFLAQTEGKKVLFLDELPNTEPRLQAPLMQLILDKRIGEHKLPDQTWIIAAGNVESDKAHLHDLAGPLLKRLIVFRVEPEIEIWTRWAIKNKIDNKIISFLAANPRYLDINLQDQNFNETETITCNPRGWARVSQYSKENIESDDLYLITAGIIGERVAIEFVNHCKEINESPKIEDVLAMKSPKDIESKIPNKTGVLWNIVYQVCNETQTPERVQKVFEFLLNLGETKLEMAQELSGFGLQEVRRTLEERKKIQWMAKLFGKQGISTKLKEYLTKIDQEIRPILNEEL